MDKINFNSNHGYREEFTSLFENVNKLILITSAIITANHSIKTNSFDRRDLTSIFYDYLVSPTSDLQYFPVSKSVNEKDQYSALQYMVTVTNDDLLKELLKHIIKKKAKFILDKNLPFPTKTMTTNTKIKLEKKYSISSEEVIDWFWNIINNKKNIDIKSEVFSLENKFLLKELVKVFVRDRLKYNSVEEIEKSELYELDNIENTQKFIKSDFFDLYNFVEDYFQKSIEKNQK